jgi:hypothetical protein
MCWLESGSRYLLLLKLIPLQPGAVAHACNSSYSGGRDWEDGGSRPAWAKSSRDPISINNLGVVVNTCHPSYAGSQGGMIAAHTGLGINARLFEK